MKVKDLIKELQAFGPDERVKVIVRSGGTPSRYAPSAITKVTEHDAFIEQIAPDHGQREAVAIEAWAV